MPVYVHYNKTHISSILVLPLDLKKKNPVQYTDPTYLRAEI